MAFNFGINPSTWLREAQANLIQFAICPFNIGRLHEGGHPDLYHITPVISLSRFPAPDFSVAPVSTGYAASLAASSIGMDGDAGESEHLARRMRDLPIALTPAFRAAFPGGIFGVLVARGCVNRPSVVASQADQRAVEARLRERFPNETVDGDPVAMAYAAYFRRYGARYPVVHQAKGIIAGRPIESPSALVEAMFTAELDSLVLTSGHDLDALAGPLRVDVAGGREAYTKLSGKPQTLKPGDMIVRDAEGVIASVLCGPDFRTRLHAESSAALFGAWCPTGLTTAVVEAHLDTLTRLLKREWPDAVIEAPRIISAEAGTS